LNKFDKNCIAYNVTIGLVQLQYGKLTKDVHNDANSDPSSRLIAPIAGTISIHSLGGIFNTMQRLCYKVPLCI